MIKNRFILTLLSTISVFPGCKTLLRFLEKLWLAQFGNARGVFHHYYEVNAWGNEESVSGPGSTLQYTENIRRMIPQLINELGASVILDAPCGDYNWFGAIDWKTEITYLGGDIVEPLVERNRSSFGNTNRKFFYLDIVHDFLPKADLWLCRDCLIHLSNRDIMLALDNFLKSDIFYILTTTYPNCARNHNIPTGSFRILNLELPPFSLGSPIRVIDDWIEGFHFRQLALWERHTLLDNLASNRFFQRTANRHRAANPENGAGNTALDED
ncbi:class I SAM-dependent methyltransferase [candidate division CSSED10-310 bacterium]|uniref:Class I SAM-dependent methyltransferase n=1 Tax=candidate division CSSED10-310 bacterium TaxID=2855610 RepID=A0ABV6YZT2_UNCC1